MHIFFIPHAGGSANAYQIFKNYIDSRIKVFPLEFAGRGKRFGENQCNTLEESAEDLLDFMIKNKMFNESYALFGHSMGSWIVFEMALTIFHDISNIKKPDHLFFSGNYAPHLSNGGQGIHKLNDKDFYNYIKKEGGTPEEIFENDKIAKYYMDIVRSDYKMTEVYRGSNRKSAIFPCDISVMSGRNDRLSEDSLKNWRQYTTEKFYFNLFEGNHFYLFQDIENVGKYINSILLNEHRRLVDE